jgi:hypothetical protein
MLVLQNSFWFDDDNPACEISAEIDSKPWTIQSGLKFTWHPILHMFVPVSSDFCGVPYMKWCLLSQQLHGDCAKP